MLISSFTLSENKVKRNEKFISALKGTCAGLLNPVVAYSKNMPKNLPLLEKQPMACDHGCALNITKFLCEIRGFYVVGFWVFKFILLYIKAFFVQIHKYKFTKLSFM